VEEVGEEEKEVQFNFSLPSTITKYSKGWKGAVTGRDGDVMRGIAPAL
jgi:hypothetical protein